MAISPPEPDAGTALSFRVLGPVEAWNAGEQINLGPPKQRRLLALLLVHANDLVRVDRLIDLVWGDRPHAGARNTAQVYVSRLRRILAGHPDVRLVTGGPGYRLEVDPGQVDLHRFRQLVAESRAADDERAADLLRQAVDLWRGDPLDDVAPDHLRATVCAALDEERAAAWEQFVEVSLRLGRHHEILGQLGELTARYPLAERLAVQYLTALYRAGRRADALGYYRSLRNRLATELGIDPSPALDEVHQRILRDDPELAAPIAAHPPAERVGVPRQLPADTAYFTGRAAELDRLLAAADRPGSTVVVSAIDGMAGVGKTALAVHAAHRLAHRYPDGQVFVDLHGFTDGVTPTSATDALEVLLRSVGVDGQIPAGLDERAALWRTRLANRRMLVLLDNAVDEGQVVPLLPGTPGSLVLVTSRRRLSGLDAEPVSLDLLSPADSAALFTAAAGPDRVAKADPVVAELVELCGRLPLAVRIAAARLRHRPAWTLAHLAHLLRKQQGRLDELRAGRHSVAAALGVSYQHLDGNQQRAFCRLGLHPGPDIEPYAAAALFDSTVDDARRLLDDLVDTHLLSEPVPGRYRFHDLVRAHAAALAADDPDGDRDRALDRLLDHYAHTATVAMDRVYAFEADQRPHPPALDAARPDLDTAEAAESWLDTELDNLLAAATFAADHNRPGHVLHQSATLQRHLRTRARLTHALTLHQHALTVARAAGDRVHERAALINLGHVELMRHRVVQAANSFQKALNVTLPTHNSADEQDALAGLGNVSRLQGRHDEAVNYFHRALQMAYVGNRTGTLSALTGLGNTYRLQGRHDQAASYYEQALRIAREIGNRHDEQIALGGLGSVHWIRGNIDQAADCYQQALRLANVTGNRPGQFNALTTLGNVHRRQGRQDQATNCYQQALQIAHSVGNQHGQLNALVGLGTVHALLGRTVQAVACYQQALQIAHSIDDRNGQFEAHCGLGQCHQATNHHQDALIQYDIALGFATELGQPHDMARAHDGLARTHRALGNNEKARYHWRLSLDILAASGISHTDDPQVTTETIRTQLADLDMAPATQRRRLQGTSSLHGHHFGLERGHGD